MKAIEQYFHVVLFIMLYKIVLTVSSAVLVVYNLRTFVSRCKYSSSTLQTYRVHDVMPVDTAAWLAQLVERRTAVREVEGSSPRPDRHSGS